MLQWRSPLLEKLETDADTPEAYFPIPQDLLTWYICGLNPERLVPVLHECGPKKKMVTILMLFMPDFPPISRLS